jgi:hypothetical protein
MAAKLKRKKELEKIQESGDKLPDLRRLHPSVWSDIKQGKYINLADMFSRSDPGARNPLMDPGEFDSAEWSYAFALLIRASAFFDTERVRYLLDFQCQVLAMVRIYAWEHIRDWDHDVRMAIANEPALDLTAFADPASVVAINPLHVWKHAHRSLCTRCSSQSHTAKFCTMPKPSKMSQPRGRAPKTQGLASQPCCKFLLSKSGCPGECGRLHKCPQCHASDEGKMKVGSCSTCLPWVPSESAKRFKRDASALCKGA